MILTNNDKLAKKAKHITTTAKSHPTEYFHDEIGYNFRLVNILAAIGLAQMENIEDILSKKKRIFDKYFYNLKGVGDIRFQGLIENSTSNCWLFTFRTSKMKMLLKHLNNKGIESRPFWVPMNQLPMYKNLKYISEENNSKLLFEECISIPSSSNLSKFDQEKVIFEIKNFFKK